MTQANIGIQAAPAFRALGSLGPSVPEQYATPICISFPSGIGAHSLKCVLAWLLQRADSQTLATRALGR